MEAEEWNNDQRNVSERVRERRQELDGEVLPEKVDISVQNT